jgi:hypothetical protein
MLRTVKNQMLLAYRAGTNNLKMTSTSGYKLNNDQVNQVFMKSIMGVASHRNFSTENSNPPKTDDALAPKKRKPRTPKAVVAKEAKSEVAPDLVEKALNLVKEVVIEAPKRKRASSK